MRQLEHTDPSYVWSSSFTPVSFWTELEDLILLNHIFKDNIEICFYICWLINICNKVNFAKHHSEKSRHICGNSNRLWDVSTAHSCAWYLPSHQHSTALKVVGIARWLGQTSVIKSPWILSAYCFVDIFQSKTFIITYSTRNVGNRVLKEAFMLIITWSSKKEKSI